MLTRWCAAPAICARRSRSTWASSARDVQDGPTSRRNHLLRIERKSDFTRSAMELHALPSARAVGRMPPRTLLRRGAIVFVPSQSPQLDHPCRLRSEAEIQHTAENAPRWPDV